MTRRALTLLELLAALGVVAVLAGLLLAAVQKAREAANRTRCANNLRQLALAAHGYRDARDQWPGSGTVWPVEDSWLVQTGPWWESQDRVTWCTSRRHMTGSSKLYSETDYQVPAPNGLFGRFSDRAVDPLFDQGGLVVQNGSRRWPSRGEPSRGYSQTLLIGHGFREAKFEDVPTDNHWRHGHHLPTVRDPNWGIHPDGPEEPGWNLGFGAPHSACPFARADGSVQLLAFDRAPAELAAACRR